MPVASYTAQCVGSICRTSVPSGPYYRDQGGIDLAGRMIGQIGSETGTYDPGTYAIAVELWKRLDAGLLTAAEASRFVQLLQEMVAQIAFLRAARIRGEATATTGACCASCQWDLPCESGCPG